LIDWRRDQWRDCSRRLGWEDWLHLDTADTLAVDDGESDEAIFAPACAPGVLDDPVLLAMIGTVTNGEDSVVKIGAARCGVEDTIFVVLKCRLVSLDGDREWLTSKGGLHLGNVIFLDVGVGCDLGSSLALRIVLALAIQASVCVHRLKFGVVRLVVLEGLVLPATVASMVSGGAVHKLLLREGKKLSGSDLMSTLERTSG